MLNRFFPYSIYRRLWGDRAHFACLPDIEDQDWITWLDKGYTDFYQNTQRRGIGSIVAKLSHAVLTNVDFTDKIVLEVGPGYISHLSSMNSKPKKYVLCDVQEDFLYQSKKKLDKAGIYNATTLLDRNNDSSLPFPDESFDIIISFNTLEHLYPLDTYLLEMKRKLRSQGLFLGGIPCEGGIAWGLGRFLTTRRYVHQKYNINYDKIICWEHPNFAEYILDRLNFHFEQEYLKRHPFAVLSLDFNLMASFIYRKT